MKKQHGARWMAAGLVLGMVIGSPLARAAENWRKAVPTWQPIYVDGQQVQMEAYNINGNNYVKLRDIGKEVGFNVYWQDGVQVDSHSVYTGEAPAAEAEKDVSTEQIRLDIVQGINALRREAGVPEVVVNESLMEAAQICAEKEWTKHHNQEECETVLACGYPHGFGCNLTHFTNNVGVNNAERAVRNWKNSPGHYQTAIDANCDCIGIGVHITDNWIYCVMFIGNPNSYNPYG